MQPAPPHVDDGLLCRAYRVLSNQFEVRSNDTRVDAAIHAALRRFLIPPDVWRRRDWPFGWDLTVYSLLREENDKTPFAIYRNAELVCRSETADGLIDRTIWQFNWDVGAYARDYFIVHAGAVVPAAGGALLLPSASGNGKSTLVAALVNAGFGYLSDEFAPIDPIGHHVHAFPRAITLKEGSFDAVGGLAGTQRAPLSAGSQWHLDAEELGGHVATSPQRLRWVITPKYVSGGSTTCTPVTRAQVVHLLAEQSRSLGFYGSRALPLLLQATEGVAGYRLEYGDLGDAITTVSRLCGHDRALT